MAACIRASVITSAGTGLGHVQVYLSNGSNFTTGASFNAYTSADKVATGAVVSAGDTDGDGRAEIITAPGSGTAAIIRQFNGLTGAVIRSFTAFESTFTGGVSIAVGDFNSDGFADIVTAPGIWSGPDIRIFDGKTLTDAGTGSIIGEFLAYDPRYFGGVFVSTGDVNGDGLPDIITGTNGNGGPEVKAFSGANVMSSPTPTIIDDFFAYNPAFNGGARVAVIDIHGHEDIVTGAGPGGGPQVRIFDGATGVQLPDAQDSFYAFDVLFSGGVFVGGT